MVSEGEERERAGSDASPVRVLRQWAPRRGPLPVTATSVRFARGQCNVPADRRRAPGRSSEMSQTAAPPVNQSHEARNARENTSPQRAPKAPRCRCRSHRRSPPLFRRWPRIVPQMAGSCQLWHVVTERQLLRQQQPCVRRRQPGKRNPGRSYKESGKENRGFAAAGWGLSALRCRCRLSGQHADSVVARAAGSHGLGRGSRICVRGVRQAARPGRQMALLPAVSARGSTALGTAAQALPIRPETGARLSPVSALPSRLVSGP
jgi:hypothetical protein